MFTGLRTSEVVKKTRAHLDSDVIIVNISVSGSRLGGASIAAEWHSQFLSDLENVELWRMWDNDSTTLLGSLQVRNFTTELPFSHLALYLPRRARALLLRSNILKEILKIRPKIVHLQNPAPALEFERIAKVCKLNGIKVVASTHGFYEVFNPNYGWKWYEQYGWQKWMTQPIARSLKHIDAFISGYPDEKNMLLEKGVPEEKIHLVPNGINPYFGQLSTPEEKEFVLSKFGIQQSTPILLFIGNHTSNKGIDTVLEVSAVLSQSATVVIGGKLLSPDEPEQRLAQMPASHLTNIIFTDYLTETEQRVLYHLADLLLFPSLADTLPLTILEAMACGLPVIAYDTGGISFQLAEQAGVIVPQGDVQAFTNAIETLLSNPSECKQISQNAIARQRKLFSWKLAAEDTAQIYKLLLANN
jgi:alpha-maltose-1-phosphate synthase